MLLLNRDSNYRFVLTTIDKMQKHFEKDTKHFITNLLLCSFVPFVVQSSEKIIKL